MNELQKRAAAFFTSGYKYRIQIGKSEYKELDNLERHGIPSDWEGHGINLAVEALKS